MIRTFAKISNSNKTAEMKVGDKEEGELIWSDSASLCLLCRFSALVGYVHYLFVDLLIIDK